MIALSQMTGRAWLKANKKTGSKKKENEKRKCLTVLLSNQEMTGIRRIFFKEEQRECRIC